MTFAHRPPATIRFVAYSAAIMDLAVGVGLAVMGAQGPAGRGLLVAGIVLIASSWIVPWILLGVRYELEDGELIVRRGPIAGRIALEDVDEVRIAAPLPGLDGVILTHHRGGRPHTVPLHPDDAPQFLRQIAMAAGHLEAVDDGSLRRRSAALPAAAAP